MGGSSDVKEKVSIVIDSLFLVVDYFNNTKYANIFIDVDKELESYIHPADYSNLCYCINRSYEEKKVFLRVRSIRNACYFLLDVSVQKIARGYQLDGIIIDDSDNLIHC